MSAPEFDTETRTQLEAAAFRRLVEHLRERTDVQNIDMMNLAGFCRNCLSRWYREEAAAQGINITDPDAREVVYGMPYKEWQAKYQAEASPDQKAAFGKMIRVIDTNQIATTSENRYHRAAADLKGRHISCAGL